jgi:hypothetical protein
MSNTSERLSNEPSLPPHAPISRRRVGVGVGALVALTLLGGTPVLEAGLDPQKGARVVPVDPLHPVPTAEDRVITLGTQPVTLVNGRHVAQFPDTPNPLRNLDTYNTRSVTVTGVALSGDPLVQKIALITENRQRVQASQAQNGVFSPLNRDGDPYDYDIVAGIAILGNRTAVAGRVVRNNRSHGRIDIQEPILNRKESVKVPSSNEGFSEVRQPRSSDLAVLETHDAVSGNRIGVLSLASGTYQDIDGSQRLRTVDGVVQQPETGALVAVGLYAPDSKNPNAIAGYYQTTIRSGRLTETTLHHPEFTSIVGAVPRFDPKGQLLEVLATGMAEGKVYRINAENDSVQTIDAATAIQNQMKGYFGRDQQITATVEMAVPLPDGGMCTTGFGIVPGGVPSAERQAAAIDLNQKRRLEILNRQKGGTQHTLIAAAVGSVWPNVALFDKDGNLRAMTMYFSPKDPNFITNQPQVGNLQGVNAVIVTPRYDGASAILTDDLLVGRAVAINNGIYTGDFRVFTPEASRLPK